MNKVPCGKCVVCCQNIWIFILPGDCYEYKTTTIKGLKILQQKANGDCIYLRRNSGCTIYKQRPQMCERFDCREAVKSPRKHPRSMVKAAKKCHKRAK